VAALLLSFFQKDNETGFFWVCVMDIYLRSEENCLWTSEIRRLFYSHILSSQLFWNLVKVNISQTCSLSLSPLRSRWHRPWLWRQSRWPKRRR